MQLEHSFTVPIGIDEAWPILIDIERIGPCMPGATIDSVDGDQFTGTVKVKLGPINLTYKGKATFLEKDEAARRVVIDARGRDARGNGTAAAKVTATMHDDGGGSTTVKVNTDLDITGKPAQFGRGVMVDVGNKLLGQFADSLARTIGAGQPTTEPGASAPSASADDTTADDTTSANTTATDATAQTAAAPAKRARPKPSGTTAAATQDAAGATAEIAAADAAAAAAEVNVETSDPRADEGDTEDVTDDGMDDGMDDGAGERVPSYSVPSGVPADDPAQFAPANGQSAFRASTREGEVEPINLLQSAGPAVAKRLAPIAVALVVVLIAARRRSNKRG